MWFGRDVPEAWHLQRVAMIFKKGDPALCANYRPICLLNAAYKVSAMILLRRLVAAGADGKIWGTQFGFKRGCGTEDASALRETEQPRPLSRTGHSGQPYNASTGQGGA